MRKMNWVALAVVPVLGLAAASGRAQQSGQPSNQPSVQPGQPGRQPGRQFDPAQMIERMMEQDANGDGKLSREEVAGGQGERLFDRADANQDGYVDRAELEATFAARQPGREGGPAAGGGQGGAMTFEAGMSQAGRAMRRLGRSEFAEGTRAGDLAALEQVQVGLVMAKQQLATVEMSEAAKAKFGEDTAAYQMAMRESLVKSLRETLEMELAIAAGEAGKAATARARLLELQDAAHKLFQHEDEEEGVRPAGGPSARPARPGAGG